MLETCTVVATACKNCDNKRENQNRPGFQFERNCRCDLLWRMLQALDTKNQVRAGTTPSRQVGHGQASN